MKRFITKKLIEMEEQLLNVCPECQEGFVPGSQGSVIPLPISRAFSMCLCGIRQILPVRLGAVLEQSFPYMVHYVIMMEKTGRKISVWTQEH